MIFINRNGYANQIRPAWDAIKDEAYQSGLQQGQSANVQAIAQGVAGVLGRTADTVLGVIQSNNQVEIERLRAESAQALAQIQGQLGSATGAQRRSLEQDQMMLQLLMGRLQNQQQPSNTMLYVALAGVAVLGYMILSKPAPTSRRNPVRRRRSVRRSRR